MKKLISLFVPLFAISGLAVAQKSDRENLQYEATHIPARLIYDQVKTYGITTSTDNNSLFTLDNYLAAGLPVSFTSFEKVEYAKADLKVQAAYGPCLAVEEKTASETREEKVDSVKKKVTYYKRVFYFKYPISYKLINGKNNAVLYANATADGEIRSVETAFFKTEAEATKTMNENRTYLLTNNISEQCKNFISLSNGSIRDLFDFYPQQVYLDIYRIKKWDKSDDYNAHIKNIMEVFKSQLQADQPATIKEKIKDDLAYLQSFEGLFNPTDKKEDVLYFCNYFNLATIYLGLDDFDKANFYLQKLDSSDEKERRTSYLKSVVALTQKRTATHLLTTTHLNYNPVKDYRLAGKNFKSDAGEAPVVVAAPPVTVSAAPKIVSQLGHIKEVLNAIWLAYQCWNTGSNTVYLEPADYIFQERSDLILGQKFLYPVNNNKYITIKLDYVNTQIPTGTFGEFMNNYKVWLSWNEDKLTGIKIEYLSGFDFTVDRGPDGNIIGFTSKELINKITQTMFRSEFNNNRLAKITRYENNVNTPPTWIRSIKTFTYTDTATVVDCLTYFTNKPNLPKNSNTITGVYKKSRSNPYIVVQPYGETTEISYNASDVVEKKIVRKRNSVEEHVYTYTDGKLFKEETVARNLDGSFVIRDVQIAFTLNGLSAAVPDYEKLKGSYKFNQNNELVYEARDGKYRKKEGGVWSDWMFFRY